MKTKCLAKLKYCSIVEQFASRHCCVWHTCSVPPRT